NGIGSDEFEFGSGIIFGFGKVAGTYIHSDHRRCPVGEFFVVPESRSGDSLRGILCQTRRKCGDAGDDGNPQYASHLRPPASSICENERVQNQMNRRSGFFGPVLTAVELTARRTNGGWSRYEPPKKKHK